MSGREGAYLIFKDAAESRRKGFRFIEKQAGRRENNRRVGARYEELAAEYLRGQGYYILEHNFRCGLGEIDLIAREGDTLVFVEVKYRSRSDCGAPSDAVNHKKQVRISDAASYYLYKNYGTVPVTCRFDVVSIQNQEIALYRNAFPYAGNYNF